MEKIIQLISNNWQGIVSALIFISIFIEITPIKINPISKLLKWIGNNINKETKEQLNNISIRVDALSNGLDKMKIDDKRKIILDFGNSCMRGEQHTQEEFAYIFSTHEKYLRILERHGKTNGQVDIAYKYICDVYQECLKNNKFLKSTITVTSDIL